jgi:hypothetical protein
MKALFTVLLIANLLLVGYALLGPLPGAVSSQPPSAPLNAEQIQIIAPRPPAAARPAACIQWGSFAEADLDAVRRALAGAGLTPRASEIALPVMAGWWVYIPPLPDRAAIDRQVRELQAAGVTDYYVVDADGPLRNAISLGIFKTEESARAQLLAMQGKGVRIARAAPREQRVTHTAVLVREPDAQVSARLAELALRFPGSELRALDCPS